MLSRIKWESIDELRPPQGSLKHIPPSEYAAFARSIQQQGKEVPTKLKAYLEPSQLRRQFARKHYTSKECQFDRISDTVYQGVIPRLQPLSPFEHLPWELQNKIFDDLDSEDCVCVGLSCSIMMRSIHKHFKSHNAHGTSGVELMELLTDWMPAHLTLCYHCLTYLPGLSFGPERSEFSDLMCMDCKFYTERPFPVAACHGCDALQWKVEEILEEDTTLDSARVWDEVLGQVNDPTDDERRSSDEESMVSDDEEQSLSDEAAALED